MNDNSSTRTTFDWHDNADGGSSCRVGNRLLVVEQRGVFFNSSIYLPNVYGLFNRILASYRYAPRSRDEAKEFLEREYEGWVTSGCGNWGDPNAFDIRMEGTEYWCKANANYIIIYCNDLGDIHDEIVDVKIDPDERPSLEKQCISIIRERRNRLSDYLLNVVV
jgi:hypothetical protein